MLVTWSDTQLCEFTDWLQFAPFYRRINRDPEILNDLFVQDHITKKKQKIWQNSVFLTLKFLFSNVYFLSQFDVKMSHVSFPINKLFWIWLQKAHNLHFKHWTRSKASTEEGYHVNWHFLRIHDRVSINSYI